MAENQTKTYADRAPEIPFKLKSFSKEGEKRFAHLINTVADYSETGKSVLETAANEGYQLQMMLMGGQLRLCLPRNKDDILEFRGKRRTFNRNAGSRMPAHPTTQKRNTVRARRICFARCRKAQPCQRSRCRNDGGVGGV